MTPKQVKQQCLKIEKKITQAKNCIDDAAEMAGQIMRYGGLAGEPQEGMTVCYYELDMVASVIMEHLEGWAKDAP